MRQNPERFIESNLDQSWLEYSENMSRQGTWADNVIIQAIADALNLKIIITESDPSFADFNIIEATNPHQECVTVYVGHIGEVHYVPTKKCISKQTVQETREDSNTVLNVTKRMEQRSPVNSFMNNKNPEVTPVQASLNLVNEKSACFSSLQILETRLLDYGLVPVEVGGQGNCFFHVISHQLFDDPKHHFYIRAAKTKPRKIH